MGTTHLTEFHVVRKDGPHDWYKTGEVVRARARFVAGHGETVRGRHSRMSESRDVFILDRVGREGAPLAGVRVREAGRAGGVAVKKTLSNGWSLTWTPARPNTVYIDDDARGTWSDSAIRIDGTFRRGEEKTMKPFVAKKSGSGWKLYLYRSRLAGYASARAIERFDRKPTVPTGDVLAISERRVGGRKQVGFEPAERATVYGSKREVSSIAHLIGRYIFGLGDMVFAYLVFEESGRSAGRWSESSYEQLQRNTLRRRDPGMFHSDVGYHLERMTGSHRDDVIALINRDSVSREIERLRVRGEDSVDVAARFAKLLRSGRYGLNSGKISKKHLSADARDFRGIDRDAADIRKRVKKLVSRDRKVGSARGRAGYS